MYLYCNNMYLYGGEDALAIRRNDNIEYYIIIIVQLIEIHCL